MQMMILWFVLLSGNAGYIEPIYVTPASCGLPAFVDSLQGDREVNPRVARWADCAVDIREKISTLTPGVYEFAATGLGAYNPPDPHTSHVFLVAPDFEEQTQPAKPTDKFTWTQDAPVANAQTYRYELELDGVLQTAPLVHTCVASPTAPTMASICTAPIPAVTPGDHSARVRTVDVSIPEVLQWIFTDYSNTATFRMRAVPTTPRQFGVQPPPPQE